MPHLRGMNAHMHDASTEPRPPSAWLMLLEGRAPWEYAATLAVMPWLSRVPAGDGHPVIVFPGLGASELSTRTLRGFLAQLGYATYDWGLGQNRPREGLLDACRERVLEVAARHGRKVSLVGWSLGGVYARELAKMMPEDVRLVITLGSPFTGSHKATNAWRVYQLVSGEKEIDEARFAALKETPRVPTTSIFSRTDGVVAWQCSVEQETATSENIEVHASHVGMGLNPTALYAIADRLAQPEGQWKRFDHKAHTGIKKLLFLDPARSSWPNPFFGFY